jgi:hypothetical protein
MGFRRNSQCDRYVNTDSVGSGWDRLRAEHDFQAAIIVEEL